MLDFKSVSLRVFKKRLPIKIQENKRFFVTRGSLKNIKVQGEPNFKFFLNSPQIITKRGRDCFSCPSQIQKGVPVADAKKKDIKSLILVHAGVNWEQDIRLNFLKSIVIDSLIEERLEDEEDTICSCLDEDAVSRHV